MLWQIRGRIEVKGLYFEQVLFREDNTIGNPLRVPLPNLVGFFYSVVCYMRSLIQHKFREPMGLQISLQLCFVLAFQSCIGLYLYHTVCEITIGRSKLDFQCLLNGLARA